MKSILTGVAVVALVTGCAGTTPRTGAPAPIEQRDTEQPGTTKQPDEAVISAYRAPAPVEIAKPRPARAAEVLAARAEDQRRAGQFDAAAASLERALRIAPRDALLWHRLALVRRDQRQYGAAIELANKSNSLARRDLTLKRDNWQLIANVRRAQGDDRGARAAEDRAAELR